jgi:hypothetical protein
MKLAEALLLRADIQKKLASLQARAQKYAFVQEGEQPAEDPTAILREVEAVTGEFRRLVYAINRTNLNHTIATGQSITEALAARDALVLRHRILQGVIDAGVKPPRSGTGSRRSGGSPRWTWRRSRGRWTNWPSRSGS